MKNINLPYSSTEIENVLIAFGWTKPPKGSYTPWRLNKDEWGYRKIYRLTLIDAWNYQFNEE